MENAWSIWSRKYSQYPKKQSIYSCKSIIYDTTSLALDVFLLKSFRGYKKSSVGLRDYFTSWQLRCIICGDWHHCKARYEMFPLNILKQKRNFAFTWVLIQVIKTWRLPRHLMKLKQGIPVFAIKSPAKAFNIHNMYR